MLIVWIARIAIAAAAVAPIITQDLTPLLVMLFGYLGQLAKSRPWFPNIAAQGAMLGLGLVAYFLQHGYDPAAPNWLSNAMAATLAVPGFATVMGTAGLAPATSR